MTEHPSTDHIALVGDVVDVQRIVIVDSRRPWHLRLISGLKRFTRMNPAETSPRRNRPLNRVLMAGLLDFQAADKKLAIALFQDTDDFRLIVRRLGPDQFHISLVTAPTKNAEEQIRLDAAMINRFDWLAVKSIKIVYGPKEPARKTGIRDTINSLISATKRRIRSGKSGDKNS